MKLLGGGSVITRLPRLVQDKFSLTYVLSRETKHLFLEGKVYMLKGMVWAKKAEVV